eukprot:jgi/Mesen1/4555/ME000232S03810
MRNSDSGALCSQGDLSDLRVGGTLHPDTGALASLRFLRLRNNGLAGTLPGRLLQLEHLEELDVSYNDFNGTLQAELQPNLTILNAQHPHLDQVSVHPPRKMATGTKVSALPAVVGGLLAGLVVVCACTLVAMLVARNRRARNLLRLQEQKIASTQRAPAHGELGQLLRFSSADIAHAKQRKGNAVIGEGGFGIVYHGRLPSGADVAIKALKPRASEAVAEVTSFQTEVELISRAVHANLLRLIGFCAEDNERALVYPYMPNQSVASKLRDRNGSGLTWATRMRIARGAAEGLAYMHYDCSPRIIHRDVKAPRKMATGTKVSALPAVVGGLLAGLVVVCACTLVAMLVARNRRARNLLRLQEQKIASTQRAPAHGELGQLLRFSSADIAHAKQRKGNAVIGEGGFGIVYHGRLPSGADVAIKALKPRASEAVAEVTSFQTEVELISRAVHANLLRLIGFCAEDNERALVYPYMPNQSVASKLRDRNGSGLTWATRMRIARGAAEGLAYMHYDCSPRIIHRDADNVLLDSEFNAVLGDFGLARMIPEKHTHVTSVVKGSFGYIPLEYLMTGKLTDKTDVFGFGMFLMELLTGAPANKLELRAESEEMTSVSDWVMIHFQVGTMAKVLDPRLVAGGGYDEAEVNRVVQVAILCMQKSPAGRPTMKECLSFFNGKGLDDRWRAWLLIESVQVHVDAYASNADGTRSRWDPSRNNVQVSQAVDDNGLDDVTPPAALGHVV